MKQLAGTLLSSFIISFTMGQDIAPGYKTELIPYVKFLTDKKHHQTASDYIISLFDKYDLVILCEREHPEFTQYELINEVVHNKKFINKIGNIFTEVGVSALRPEVNAYIHQRNISPKQQEEKLLHIQRNISYWALWRNTNITYLIERIYQLNRSLPLKSQVDIFPSDLYFNWSDTRDSGTLAHFRKTSFPMRDSLMARNIIDKFEELRKVDKRVKGLVIMNYRHAFNDHFYFKGVKGDNVGRYLFERYPGKVANVYINGKPILGARSDSDVDFGALADGKWDAAFEVTGIENAGFNFEKSPFGEDHFDIWPFEQPYHFKDIFTGLVYYKSPKNQIWLTGRKGFFDSSFYKEYIRRVKLENLVSKEKDTLPSFVEMQKLNKIDTTRQLPSTTVQLIRQWFNKN